jgi:hypothetical protein
MYIIYSIGFAFFSLIHSSLIHISPCISLKYAQVELEKVLLALLYSLSGLLPAVHWPQIGCIFRCLFFFVCTLLGLRGI